MLWKGIALMTGAWVLFAFMSAFAKLSYAHTSSDVAFFFQNAGAFFFLLPYFLKERSILLKTEQWRLILFRSLLGTAAFYSLFWSLARVPLTDATLLNNAAPLFVPFFAALLLKTPIRRSITLSATVGFFGVILILKPTDGLLQINALPALLSALCSGLVMVVIRMLSGENTRRLIFIYLAISSTLALALSYSNLSKIPLQALPTLLAIGPLFGLAQLLYTRALRYAEPSILAPFSYAFVAASCLIDWLAWDHPPAPLSAAGILLVFLGGYLTIRFSRNKVLARTN